MILLEKTPSRWKLYQRHFMMNVLPDRLQTNPRPKECQSWPQLRPKFLWRFCSLPEWLASTCFAQGLAARVTKWSTECDKALHRLVCYIHSTLDLKLRAFIGDSIHECKLWCFADADHAGEYANRSTSGCFLVLVGPNSYFPLTAFSKKQTSVSMSSTEAEVVAANVTLRAVGLPSSGLWAYLQNAGGDQSIREVCQLPKSNVMQVWKETNAFLTPVGES